MKFLIALLIPAFAFAMPSSQRELTGDHIKNNSAVLALPTSSDTLIGRATADTLSNKGINASSNTITNLSNGNFSASAAIDFSKLANLTNGNILIGNGSNVATSVTPSGDLSISNTGAFTLGTVAIAKGGTNNASLPTTAGGVLYMDGTRAQNTGAGTSSQILFGGTTPAFGTLSAPTVQKFTTTTGSTIGSWIYFTGTATYAAGDTYTDGASHVFTALQACAACVEGLWSTGSAAAISGNLTRTTGAGSASITNSASGALAQYTPTAGTKIVKITLSGGGGSGGGCQATGAAQCDASAGGNSGAVGIKWISNPSGTIYYSVGAGAAAPSAGNNNGLRGGMSSIFVTGTGSVMAEGGYGGSAAPTAAAPNIGFGGVNGSSTVNADIAANGQNGLPGICLSATSGAVTAGNGGGGVIGGGGLAGAFSSFTPGTAGGGGAGCALSQSSSAAAGAAGGNGFVIFEEYTQ